MNRGALESRNERQSRLFKVLGKSNTATNGVISRYIDRATTDGGTIEATMCLQDYLKRNPLLLNASWLMVGSAYKAGTLYSIIPNDGSGDSSVTRATTAIRTNREALLQSMANNVPRLDYPVNGGCPSVLIEPAATNQIRNNTMVGAVVGTPGTLPAHWSSSLGGLNQQIVGTQVLNGINIIEIRFFGTATGAQLDYRFEATMQIPALVGQTWTASLYYAVLNQPLPPNNFQTQIIERNSSGSIVTDGAVSIIPTSSLVRYSQTRTLTAATTAFVQQQFRNLLTIGQSYDFTIRIGWPQMELGSVATSPIPTSGTIQTRNADVISRTGASALIGQAEGWLFAEVDLRNILDARRIIGLSDGTTSNRIGITMVSMSIRVLKDLNASLISSATQNAGTYKIAIGYNSSEIVFFINGVLIGQSATSGSGVYNRIDLGSTELATAQLNDRIRAAAIGIGRPSNSFLQDLTRP